MSVTQYINHFLRRTSLYSSHKSLIFKCMSSKKNMNCTPSEDHIVWIDTELTGLEVEKEKILEIACVITNKDLEIISEDLNIVLHQPAHVLNNMNDWCMIHHKQSGLIKESSSSNISLDEAEKTLLEHLKKYVPEKSCPLAGNSVYMDRMIIRRCMPSVDNYLHYRNIDTSTIKELTKRWYKGLYEAAPVKSFAHRALPDIKESIEELRYYKTHIFR